jgi:hypothetical protein
MYFCIKKYIIKSYVVNLVKYLALRNNLQKRPVGAANNQASEGKSAHGGTQSHGWATP